MSGRHDRRALLCQVATRVSDPSVLVVAAAAATVATVGTIGADARWVAALGRIVVERGAVPDGVPYAAAPSDGWPNVLVLAESIFHGASASLGERGFLLAQVLAVSASFALLAVDARRGGATGRGTAAALFVLLLGALPALVVVRLQLFSLALFPLLLLLLRSDMREPSARIWLLVPLVAVWSNLHGAVLVGLATAGAYLVLHRARIHAVSSLAVVAAAIVAVGATPALERTPSYYFGVLENEAARQAFGLWARLSPTQPFDLLLIASAVLLVALAVRARPSVWELVAMAAIAVLTVRTARSGVWLLMLAVAPAARSLAVPRFPRLPTAPIALILLAAAVGGLLRGPIETGGSDRVIDAAIAAAGGTPILAEPLLAEQVVHAGGRVWLANPLDAFRHADQRLYLDWLRDRPEGARALAHAPRVVLVDREGDAPVDVIARDPRFRELARDETAIAYVRIGRER